MTDPNPAPRPVPPRGPRWWPGILLVVFFLVGLVWVRAQADWPFQQRNLTSAKIIIIFTILMLVWWTFFSRMPNRLRLRITFGVAVAMIAGIALFRIRGVSGDLVPILEFRWAKRELSATPTEVAQTNSVTIVHPLSDGMSPGFPQYLGPNRNGVLPGPRLETNWVAFPPAVLWRHPVGAGWSGFVMVGDVGLTQEQRGAEECVVGYDLATGRQLWLHADPARYASTIAGDGPRGTPTIWSNRVFTCGSTGILNCFDLATGRRLWTRNAVMESGGRVPDWGYASSPLVVDELVIVHGGDDGRNSLLAFHAADGKPAWSGGVSNPGYAALSLATLAGAPQVLAFDSRVVSGHDPATGAALWKRPWGSGNAVCSLPVVVSTNRVLFSSGYGYGAELLEISRGTNAKFSAVLVWKSVRMKAKFAHLFVHDGNLYGLDDGIFACVNLADGSQLWKEGRYGHGQGLLVGEHYLLMAESGELVLLRPTETAPDELAHFRVFKAKTWNPIALSGDLLLVRNDQEAACLRLKLAR